MARFVAAKAAVPIERLRPHFSGRHLAMTL
jgi:hypothetical protein